MILKQHKSEALCFRLYSLKDDRVEYSMRVLRA